MYTISVSNVSLNGYSIFPFSFRFRFRCCCFLMISLMAKITIAKWCDGIHLNEMTIKIDSNKNNNTNFFRTHAIRRTNRRNCATEAREWISKIREYLLRGWITTILQPVKWNWENASAYHMHCGCESVQKEHGVWSEWVTKCTHG